MREDRDETFKEKPKNRTRTGKKKKPPQIDSRNWEDFEEDDYSEIMEK